MDGHETTLLTSGFDGIGYTVVTSWRVIMYRGVLLEKRFGGLAYAWHWPPILRTNHGQRDDVRTQWGATIVQIQVVPELKKVGDGWQQMIFWTSPDLTHIY